MALFGTLLAEFSNFLYAYFVPRTLDRREVGTGFAALCIACFACGFHALRIWNDGSAPKAADDAVRLVKRGLARISPGLTDAMPPCAIPALPLPEGWAAAVRACVRQEEEG